MVLELAPAQAIQQLVDELGLSPADIARALNIDTRTLARWRSGATYPQHDGRARLVELLALNHRLRASFQTMEAARGWLGDPSRYLGGLSPRDALRAGRIDRVTAALEALDSGVFL